MAHVCFTYICSISAKDVLLGRLGSSPRMLLEGLTGVPVGFPVAALLLSSALPSSLRALLSCHLEQPNRRFCLIKASASVACQAHHPLPGWPCRCPCTCPDIPLPSPDSGLLIASPNILTSERLPTLFPLPESPPRLLSLWRFHSPRENTKITHSPFHLSCFRPVSP